MKFFHVFGMDYRGVIQCGEKANIDLSKADRVKTK